MTTHNNIYNKAMIDGQIRPINGMTEILISKFSLLDRKDFMPEEHVHSSYIERNIILSNNRVILKPELVAKIVLNIKLKENENVLILGSSTGYLSALLSYLGETVIVVEENKHLLKISETAMKKNQINNVVYFNNRISDGCSQQSPFNAIIIEGAIPHVPPNLLEQLDNNGRLLAIISKNGVCNAKMFTRKQSMYSEDQLFSCSLPILDSFRNKNVFSF